MSDANLRNPWLEIGKRWKLYGSPGRPSQSEITIISSYIENYCQQKTKNNDNSAINILILGSTPEYRDMLVRLGQKYSIYVTLIDIFREMYEQMSALTKFPNKEEIFIHGSWLDKQNFKQEHYDIVLGDLIFGNVTNQEKKIAMENIAFALKRDAITIQRIERISKSWQRTPIEIIFQLWKQGPLDKYRAFDLQCLIILGHYDQKTMKYGVKQGFQLLKQYWDGKKFTHPDKEIQLFLDYFQLMWEPFEKEWAFLYEDDFKELLSQFFKLKSIQPGDDYYMVN